MSHKPKKRRQNKTIPTSKSVPKSNARPTKPIGANLWTILSQPFVQWIIVIFAICAFVYAFHETLLRVIGLGVLLLALAAFIVYWVLRERKLAVAFRSWNLWVGVAIFAIALLGALAFFTPNDVDLLKKSMGGLMGTSIIGSANVWGMLRVIALVIVGMVFVAPYFMWRTVEVVTDKGATAAPQIDGWLRERASQAQDTYNKYPVHQNVANRLKTNRQQDQVNVGATDMQLSSLPATLSVSQQKEATPEEDIDHVSQVPYSSYQIRSGVSEIAADNTEEDDDEDVLPPLLYGQVKTEEREALADRVVEIAPAGIGKENDGVVVGEGDTIALEATASDPSAFNEWQMPSADILEESDNVEFSHAEIERRAKLIEDSLASYGVDAKVTEINVGPTVTQFGLEPGWDRKYKEVKEKDKDGNTKTTRKEISKTRVKVERIKVLENDLALAIAAPSIRIEAPIPGKSMVGIEIPNTSMATTSLREVIESLSFQKLSAKSKLSLAMGKGAGNDIVVANLAKMPHLLIAGSTGSGKTVFLDAVITSLLMNNSPDDLEFVMIDPKRVELVAFNSVPHLRGAVVTDPQRAVEVLNGLTQEMDMRYRKFALVRAHNLEGYNSSDKVDKKMPAIVLIVDELADLMMSKGSEVEPLLCRLAQMGRATGIHAVVATQRPSVDVLTGLIKANFPTRVSFAVTSQIDSRTILDSVGAEKLLGRGDMLYLPVDAPKPKRVQGCYVGDNDIERVVNEWSSQWVAKKTKQAQSISSQISTTDPLLAQAKQLAKQHKQVSASFLQRKLGVGLPRATQLVELLQNDAEIASEGSGGGSVGDRDADYHNETDSRTSPVNQNPSATL